MAAKSWDSYKETLYAILDEFKPEYVLEFGPGFSTEILSNYVTVKKIESLEHDKEYAKRLEGKILPEVKLVYQPDLDLYAQYEPSFIPDLVFVDGRNRSRCLRQVRRYRCPVILHDAGREQYREAINEYQYCVWTDEGETVALCDFEETYGRILRCLGKLQYIR